MANREGLGDDWLVLEDFQGSLGELKVHTRVPPASEHTPFRQVTSTLQVTRLAIRRDAVQRWQVTSSNAHIALRAGGAPRALLLDETQGLADHLIGVNRNCCIGMLRYRRSMGAVAVALWQYLVDPPAKSHPTQYGLVTSYFSYVPPVQRDAFTIMDLFWKGQGMR